MHPSVAVGWIDAFCGGYELCGGCEFLWGWTESVVGVGF